MDDENEKSQINQKQYSKTHSCALSKLAEQAKIHLLYIILKGYIKVLVRKTVFSKIT